MKQYIYILIFVFMISIVSAISPQSLATGLTLETNIIETHNINQTFNLNIHVYDSEKGLMVSPTLLNCYYHVYSKNLNWAHILEANMTPDTSEFETTINGSYFNETGLYSIISFCERKDLTEGGFFQYRFEVVNTDKNIDNAAKLWTCPTKDNSWKVWLILIVAIVMILLAFIIEESIIGVFGGLALAFSYLFVGACAPLIFMALPVVGLLIAMKFAFYSPKN